MDEMEFIPFMTHWPCGLRIDSNCGKNIKCDDCPLSKPKEQVKQQTENFKKYVCDSAECKCQFECSECPGNKAHCPDEKMNPQVDHPSHYNQHGLEVIDIIAAFVPEWGLNDNRAVEFAHGNAIKYILRSGHKGKPAEDLKKAKWYIDYMIREIESQKN